MASIFLRHEPCPSCHSRDNLGCWSDGHKWCFGCGWYQPAVRTLSNARGEQKEDGSVFDPSHLSVDLPAKAVKWVRKYGITDEELKFYGVLWGQGRLWFPVDGCWAGRDVDGTSGHKWIIMGRKPLLPLFGRKVDDPCLIVFVEDVVSAIKVGRQWVASPLLGVHLSSEKLVEAARRFNSIGVWLDPDMPRKSAQAASKGRLVTGKNVFSVRERVFLLDPKELTDVTISYLLGEFLKESVT